MEDNISPITDEQLAAFLDGNVGEGEVDRILSALGDDSEVNEILSLSAMIDADVDAVGLRVFPMGDLAAANPENMCSFDCEMYILEHLDMDIDHWSLLEEAKANNWMCEGGTPLQHVGRLLELKGLYVERRYDSTLDELASELDVGKQVIAIVDKNLCNETDGAVKAPYHAIYVTGVNEENVRYLNLDRSCEESVARFEFMRAWKKSGNYMVSVSERTDVYNPQPINVEDINLGADLEELTEAIAENAHDIWARARMDEGWTYGPVRNDELKQHPDLVPYARLADSEKEYDRIMAMNTLRLVRRLGFDITNRNE